MNKNEVNSMSLTENSKRKNRFVEQKNLISIADQTGQHNNIIQLDTGISE
jgi:hypothetical protein